MRLRLFSRRLAVLLATPLFLTNGLIGFAQEPDAPDLEPSQQLREALGEREELRSALHNLEREKRFIQQRLKMLDRIVELQTQRDKVDHQLQIAEDQDDEKTIEQLDQKSSSLELQVEHLVWHYEVQEEQFELAEILRELQELGAMFAGPVQALTKSLDQMRQLRSRLLEAQLAGREDDASAIDGQLGGLERTVDYGRKHVELLHELREAFEEENEETVEALREEIGALAESFESKENKETSQNELLKVNENDPTRLPIAITPQGLAEVAQVDFQRAVVPLLQTHCFECHSSEESAGELDIERLIADQPLVKNRKKWINVIEQAKNRVMPPEDATQPSEPERTKLVLALHRKIYEFDYSGIQHPGYEHARRLTHEEYDNTIRDLFGVDLRPTKKFPADLSGSSGFENSANTLFVQPLLMERYLGAAESIIAATLPATPESDEHRRARKMIFGETASRSIADSRSNIFQRFLSRAYRRPVSNDELRRANDQFQAALDRGLDDFEAAKLVFQTALVSPNFLLKNERIGEGSESFRIDDWELASRLSYFLWASMPDEELFQLAKSETLHEPAVLHAQVDRMIHDPRSITLGSVFAAQWLGSINLGTRMRLDPIDNPWCTESLMAAMRDETAMFFHSLVLGNASIQRLIDAEYTFLNEELARLYKIRRVRGDQMRRVEITNDERGGILGHGSLLAVTSFPYRTSPVKRGHWILDTVLGTPPPPPPPNVSQLDEELEENERLSFREKLERHRREPNCYACHSEMDPLGFSLEGYDWFGRVRRGGRDRRRRERDVRGRLPNGTEFEGLPGLKRVIIEQRMDDLCRQVTSKMLSYALGRQLEYYDEKAVRKIIAAVEGDEYRFQTLIHAVVDSYPFQYKQVLQPEDK